jgi:hypothetical protein
VDDEQGNITVTLNLLIHSSSSLSARITSQEILQQG